MSVIGHSALVGAAGNQGGYQISRSVRLRSSATAWFSRTAGVPTNQYIWTVSFWTKLAQGGAFIGGGTTTPNWLYTDFGAAGMQIYYPNTGASMYLVSNALFRDPSAWYHVVLAFDSTQATPSNRVKFYVNGVQLTLSATTYPAQNSTFFWNQNGLQQRIGSITGASGNYDGYLAEFHGIDGQALTPSSFGETDAATGVWNPKKYTGTYGNNGFYLNFSDNSAATAAAIGKDSSGNGNNWTPNNISVTAGTTYDSMIDSPTNYADGGTGRGNYPVVLKTNPLTTSTVSNGNLDITSGSEQKSYVSFNMPLSGKWYFEFTANTFGASNTGFWLHACGYGVFGMPVQGAYRLLTDTVSVDITVSGSGTPSNGDVYKCAFDADTGRMWWGVNSLWFANAGNTTSNPSTNSNPSFTGVTPTDATAIIWSNQTGGGLVNCTGSWNFGQRPFSYTPPTGFNALNTYNLPAPSIANGAQYMAATTYTGNGSTQSISNAVNGISFAPDMVWVKGRNEAYYHRLTSRGITQPNYLSTNSTDAEGSVNNTISSLDSNGFTVDGVGTGGTNESGINYIGWQWKAGGTAVTNNSGTISSQVSANTSAGFSIVTYTGTGANATVGHGLGVAPQMIIVKQRSASGQNWGVYHASLGNTGGLALNLTNGTITASGWWNNTSPTSSVFSLGGSTGSDWFTTNQSSATYVAYCFSAVRGFSAFGSYTGNGSSDGPFIYTGFRARFVLVKCSSNSTASTVWTIWDTSRNTYNASVNELYPNSSGAEYVDSSGIDILSNGFKPKRNSEYANFSGWTYVYAAFAENPFSIARAR